ncbi:DUF488 domain-containing protein [Flavobacteriaceae bacterium]|nr:DUF488 domain-containing protein [Flavobacteriaceae bacterium]
MSIALFPSNSSDIMFEYKALAPNFRLLDNFKKKKISEEKFIVKYNEMLSELDPNNVLEHINLLTAGLEPILMCNCAKTKFCHRHLVADWLESNTGIIIKELNYPDYIRKKGYLVKDKAPSLFPE